MVTYIDTKNREKYQVLFDKAEQTLRDAAEHNTLPEGININTLEIVTLNQYFAYLRDLIALAANENIRSYFLRLPLDEELFEIDANSRSIKIPANFARNGVGVQGDETAEIVYFSIDRYFDHMDLANDDMNIIIQWEAKDKTKKTISGISPAFGKDIETIPGKIIFGWPIYSELTQSPGSIKFAVRFFSLGDADNDGIKPLNYSLATLTSEVSVGPTIDYDLINKTVMEIDRGSMIRNRIKNVGIYDPSVPTPAEPVISTPLYVVGYDNTVHIVDLPTEPGQGITLRVCARPEDFGAIQYDWRKYGYDSEHSDYFTTSEALDPSAISTIYEEVTTDLGDDLYYRISSEAGAAITTYAPIDVDNYLAEEHPYVTDVGFETADGSYVKLYKKYSCAVVTAPGIYTVNVGARNGVNTVFKDMEASNGIKIPGPLKPIISDPVNISVTEDHVAHIIVDDTGIVTLPVSAIAGETNKAEEEVGRNPVVTLSYDWNRIVDGAAQSVEDEEAPADLEYEYNLDHSELTISGLTAENLDERFFANVTAQRNSIRTTERSGDYRITPAPAKPVLKRRVLNAAGTGVIQKVSDYTTEEAAIDTPKTTRLGAYNSIAFSVEPIAHSDSLSYVWMRVNIQDEEPSDWITDNMPKLQVDLDTLLPDLFEDLVGDPDIAVDGVFGLTQLHDLGEVVDDADNMPEFRFNENTENGYYYCIVVNELNNHRIANVTPFYYVHSN